MCVHLNRLDEPTGKCQSSKTEIIPYSVNFYSRTIQFNLPTHCNHSTYISDVLKSTFSGGQDFHFKLG